MKVCVKLFAVARELVGRDTLEVEVPAAATVTDLQRVVVEHYPALSRVMPHALWAVDASYAAADTPLTEQSIIALIPPVSGG